MKAYNRRDFIKSGALAFGSFVLLPSCFRSKGLYRFLSDDEASCLIAFCEQLIPGDEYAGATDAGVIYYIDRQLSEIFHFNTLTYRNGIKNLQSFCKNEFGDYFENLSSKVQVNIMKKMETGKLNKGEWLDVKSDVFFDLVLEHTMQGFYGSPIHGGNKDYVSFRMLKYDYPLVIGQNRYSKSRYEK